ncbi:MAG TPA: type II toxin-antitoxin system VapC family toxin [Verrucomicrobiae bacterium]|nr:type II toxin-antitoxin system VapC family toxin [Verrucomicrobiae bacterium]
MILPDVNVLVYAHREDAVDHVRYRQWLEEIIRSDKLYGISDQVLSGFLRIVTHPRIFTDPSPISSALDFVREIREQPNCQIIAPGSRHWQIFTDMCQSLQATGNLIPDVWFAALAIESDCEWITTDSDYKKFPNLRWRHPLAGNASK